jgi:hypothetical protein
VATTATRNIPQEVHERRASYRYDVLLPVIIRIPGQQSRSARSKDVSTGGVYLLIESSDLLPGTELEMTLTLPKDVTGGAGALVRASGRIVRVDKCDADTTVRTGVAVVFEKYDFFPSTFPSC